MLFNKLCVTLLPVLLSLGAPQVGALDAITRRGKYLFKPDGTRFYIYGMAYQESVETVQDAATGGFPEPETYTDPLSLPQACARDAVNLRNTGINAIRVYSVDSTKDHSACVRSFEDAGIYLMIDLSLPAGGSINRAEPRWDVPLLQQYIATIDEFSQYNNILSFGVANEVVSNDETTAALPFVRAAIRDVKAYLRSKNRSNILVSYSSTDGPGGANGRRTQTAQYLSCGDPDEAADLMGLNTYSWCGNSSVTASGYDQLASDYASLPIAAYFSEFGCVQNVGTGNRPWTEVPALFSVPMTNSFSGGSAFGYFPKSPLAQGLDYGLVTVNGDNVTPRADLAPLGDQYRGTSPPAAAPMPAPRTSTDCPRRAGEFRASARYPPTPNPALCACMRNDAWACGPTEQTQASAQRVGELTGTACSLLTSNNVTDGCDQVIEADGSAGRYGNYSACSAVDRLTWAMSAYLDLFRLEPGTCSFDGAAVEKQNPSTAQQGRIAEAACQASNGAPLAASVPTGTAATASTNGGGSGSGSASGTARPSNAPSSATMLQAAVPGAVAFLAALAAGAFVLA